MCMQTKFTENQLEFLKNAIRNEFQTTEEEFLKGMEKGYYDWGEWRQYSGELILFILWAFYKLGEEEEVKYWKGKMKKIFEGFHQWTEKDEEMLEKRLNE